MDKKRVVVTGMGVVSPIGSDLESYWSSLTNAQSGIDHIQSFDVSEYPTRFAGECLDFESTILTSKETRRTSRFILLALEAANQAIQMSKIDIDSMPNDVGVEIGSGIGGIEILDKASQTLHSRGPSKLSPFTVPMMICDMAAGQVAIQFNAKGPNACSVTACASSTNSMGNAFRLIQNGTSKAMITGGAEACVTPLGVASFCAARSLSTRNDDPKHASRPFEKNRDGFVMGEGAGILIFEEFEHAKARGATILAEVIGFGSSGDAHHITAPAPEGEGATRSMLDALADAHIKPSDIDYINAHGTSTYLNDKNETAAIKTVFEDHAHHVAISSIKSMTGHLLGAAGAIEIIASILAIQNNIIPPTINFEEADPECDLNYTPNESISKNVDIAISNSFGFGGHNASLIVKHAS